MRAVLLLLALPAPLTAAPPALTYLFPAGGRQGTTVAVTAGGTFERWPVRAWVDRPGVAVAAAPAKGQLTITVAGDAAAGLYWLRLQDDQGASELRPFLVGTLPEVAEQEPNDDYHKPQAVPATGVVVNGRLEKPNDVDHYAVPLRKGQTLVASLEANRQLGSPVDAVLQVLSADGFVLDQNHDYHDLDPQLAFTAPADGTYVVRTFAFPSAPDSSIRFTGSERCVYRLTLTTGGFVDHAFPLAVARANPGAVDLVGWNLPEGARRLAVPPAEADVVTLSHPQWANTAQVRVEPHPAVVRAEANDRRHPQPLAWPVTVSGRIRPGLPDVYQVTGRKGQSLVIQVEARALDFPLDPVVRIADAAGKTLVQMDDPGREGGRDPEVTWTPPQDGTYLLEVRDLHDRGGGRYAYRLRLTAATPDYDLTLAADRFTLTPGKPLEIAVTVNRRHGLAKPITIRAVDLPDGVTAEPATSQPTGETAKAVKLRLTATATAKAGPFRIVGSADGQPERRAVAPIAGFPATTAAPWLTVVPEPAKK